MTTVLLLATTTGYQTRAFGEAAERLGVELVFATDRCHLIEDPWQDRAIPIRFLRRRRARSRRFVEAARAAADRRRARRRRSADGDRGARRGGARPAVAFARRRRDRARQATHARAAARCRPAGALVPAVRSTDRESRSPDSQRPIARVPTASRVSLCREAGRAVGQPRRDARRRRSGAFAAAVRSAARARCGRPTCAPSGTTAHETRAASKASSPAASTRSRG